MYSRAASVIRDRWAQVVYHRTAALVCAILIAHALLVGFNGYAHGPCWDELGHLPAGLSHWYFGQFDLYRVNPPLVRMVAAIPVICERPAMEWPGIGPGPMDRREWECGRRFTDAQGERVFWNFTTARWACIPFCLVGAWVSYRWAAVLYGPPAGLSGMTLWCFSPTILGNGQMITPDIAAASLGAAACYLFSRWLNRPTATGALAAGVLLGLAELCKTTWLILFPLWPFLWLVLRWRQRRRRGRVWREAQHVTSMVLTAIVVINVGYGFSGTGYHLGEYQFVSEALNKHACARSAEVTIEAGNRFVGTWLDSVPVPFPSDYVLGIDRQKREFEDGHASYLRGEWRHGGWWYYYLYALVVKVPLGTWMLVVLALGVAVFGCGYTTSLRDEMVLVTPIVAVLVLVSSQTGFTHHLRYVLPIFPFAFIWISKVFQSIRFGHRMVAILAAAAVLWSTGSSLYYYPHSLSYFNELVGGPNNGYRHLLHSNVDWGQDLLLFRDWLKQHPEVRPIGLAYSLPKHILDPVDVGIEYTLPPPGPDSTASRNTPTAMELGPLPGWYAIFVGELRARHRKYAYFERFEPAERLGYTIMIYHLTPGEVNQVRREMGLPEIQESKGKGGKEWQSRRVEELKS